MIASFLAFMNKCCYEHLRPSFSVFYFILFIFGWAKSLLLCGLFSIVVLGFLTAGLLYVAEQGSQALELQ